MASVKLLNAVTESSEGQWFTVASDEHIKITMPVGSVVTSGVVYVETRSSASGSTVREASITEESYFTSAVIFMKAGEQLRASFWLPEGYTVDPLTVEAIGGLA